MFQWGLTGAVLVLLLSVAAVVMMVLQERSRATNNVQKVKKPSKIRGLEEVLNGNQDDRPVRVIVSYKKDKKQVFQGKLSKASDSSTTTNNDDAASNFGKDQIIVKRTNARTMEVKASQLHDLELDDDVEYVEEDVRQFMSSETLPWGLPAIQGTNPDIPLPDPDADCFRLCIVDSGLMVTHPDIPYSGGTPTSDPNIWGRAFGLPPGQDWYNPISSHGTHVAGTIIAKGGNDEGILGIIPDNQKFCLMIARVFPDDESEGQYGSIIDEGVEWCADNGARIINMSLGGRDYTKTSHDLHEALAKEGVLVVAAAGNDGSDGYAYPASHSEVLSVSAVTPSLKHAEFSQANDQVDVAAPGVDILSTIPSGTVVTDENGHVYQAEMVELAPVPSSPASGRILDCGATPNNEISTLSPGKICLVKRCAKMANMMIDCATGGAQGVIFYNDEDPMFFIKLTEDLLVDIPVVTVSGLHGQTLLSSNYAQIDFGVPSYGIRSGTSMASPHVTGLAARIWAARPNCTNTQIRQAIQETALDLGETGKDNETGRGLVQAEDAYKYLLSLPWPCGDPAARTSPLNNLLPRKPRETVSNSPSFVAPTFSPVAAQSSTPSIGQSAIPSIQQSSNPSVVSSRVPTTTPTKQSSQVPSNSPSASPTLARVAQIGYKAPSAPTVSRSSPTVAPSNAPSRPHFHWPDSLQSNTDHQSISSQDIPTVSRASPTITASNAPSRPHFHWPDGMPSPPTMLLEGLSQDPVQTAESDEALSFGKESHVAAPAKKPSQSPALATTGVDAALSFGTDSHLASKSPKSDNETQTQPMSKADQKSSQTLDEALSRSEPKPGDAAGRRHRFLKGSDRAHGT